jgi:hypothetical protein
MSVNRRLVAIVGSIVLVAGLAIGYFLLTQPPTKTPSQTPQPSQSSPDQTQYQSNNSSSNPQPPSGGSPSAGYPLKVFFSKHPDSDNDPSKTFGVERISPDLGVGTFAVAELLKGPTDTEKNQGYFASARLRGGDDSICDNRDFILTIDGTTATLRFCRQFDHVGVISDGQAESEIKATLTQFSNIKKVIILNKKSDCEFNLSDQNLCKQ